MTKLPISDTQNTIITSSIIILLLVLIIYFIYNDQARKKFLMLHLFSNIKNYKIHRE